MADVETPPPSIDTQDPLPESNWLYRRWFTFIVTSIAIIGIALITYGIYGMRVSHEEQVIDHFYSEIWWLLILLWIIVTYYMVAPSAEQVAKMVQTAGMLRAGVVTTSTQTATAPDGSRATATTKTGVAPIPSVDPALPAGASNLTGLPDITSTYAGPALDEVPAAHPGLPEEAPWR